MFRITKIVQLNAINYKNSENYNLMLLFDIRFASTDFIKIFIIFIIDIIFII